MSEYPLSEASATRILEWCGPVPAVCDVCQAPIVETFIDGATVWGPWGNMCPGCHKAKGKGLGTGRGQRYEKVGDRWIKTAG